MTGSQKRRVLVGMSGGVDSSATAALLQAEGFDVVGVTLKLWPQDCVDRAEDKCCGPQAVMDARSVCAKLGVPYYLVDEAALFQQKVIGYFAEEHKAGRTPNPCVMCNKHLKFGVLLDRARQLDCDLIATGHFALQPGFRAAASPAATYFKTSHGGQLGAIRGGEVLRSLADLCDRLAGEVSDPAFRREVRRRSAFERIGSARHRAGLGDLSGCRKSFTTALVTAPILPVAWSRSVQVHLWPGRLTCTVRPQ